MTATSTTGRNNQCWVQRDFLKDKLRVKERYWHTLEEFSSLSEQLFPNYNHPCNYQHHDDGDHQHHHHHRRRWILPDALAWRKYLPLIIYLIDLERDTFMGSSTSTTTESSSSTRWILLESVVEWMDYRNLSSVIIISSDQKGNVVSPPEKVIPQERSKFQKLLLLQQQQQPQPSSSSSSSAVIPFCDLSVRQHDEEEEDEWYMMNYEELSIPQRSQHAIFRAARLLQQLFMRQQQQQQRSYTETTTTPPEIWILSGDVNFVHRFKEDEEDGDDVKIVLLQDLLDKMTDWLSTVAVTVTSKIEHARRLAKKCEDDYLARNGALASSWSSSDNDSTGGVQQHQQQDSGEYWTDEAIQFGLGNKSLCQGRFMVTKENPKEAFVKDRNGNSYFINQHYGHFNRAIHQDIVVVQPLPKEQWTSPVGRRRLVPIRNDDNDILEDEHHHHHHDDDNNDIVNRHPPVPSGRVVAILHESRRQLVATMVNTPINNDESSCIVVPMDIRIPKIRIKTNAWQRFIGNRLWVQIDDWEVGSMYPSGHCVEILGPIANLETEITCLLKENQIHLQPFSAAAMACLPWQGHQWTIPESEINIRRDLRSLSIFSVDPVGCQDIDDTMHARILPNGDVEVGVHIADVTYFVDHNSALDREAQVRGTTFYLVDRRFDMLPTLLSSDLCSLHGNVDRLAVSTIWTFSSDLKQVKHFWYGKSVIHNIQAMTYEQAHNILHDVPPQDSSAPQPPPLTAGYPVHQNNIKSLKNDLTLLTQLARILRRDREELGGAVDLSSGDQGNELKFVLDAQGNPVQVTPKKQMEIHHTIAELMILANTYVAKTIFERFPQSALLRIHQSVDESRFEDLKEVLEAGNIKFDGSSNMKLAASLKAAESKSDSAVSSLFHSLATRAMSEAQYVSTGEINGASGLSHYGLGLEKYTHFTSPIRRYADIVVHRQLLQADRPKKPMSVRPPPGFHREALETLPESGMISILHGEGLKGSHSGQESMSSVISPPKIPSSESIVTVSLTAEDEDGLYDNQQISKICDNLNQQNRMAKLSSFECQSLFLSLCFKDRSELTRAVVTNLRVNGFFAYVPRFDFRAPVFISDKDGNLQMDPELLKLSSSAGLPPSGGFTASPYARKFPSGRCTTVQDSTGNEMLEISVPDSSAKYFLKVLDVVTVTISCDDWNTKSRIPPPRIHWIADSRGSPRSGKNNRNNKAAERTEESKKSKNVTMTPIMSKVEPCKVSLYDEITRIETPAKLAVDVRTLQKYNRGELSGTSVIPGRLAFGGFVNPDTRSAQQEAAIHDASEAAMERRNQILASRARQSEFDTTKRIEKEVTARMQRLAVNKRNARIKGKGK